MTPRTSRSALLQIPPRILGVDEMLFGVGLILGLILAVTLGPGLTGWTTGFLGWVVLHGTLIRLSRQDVLAPYKLLRYVLEARRTPAHTTEEELLPWIASHLLD
jgi:hypothetical protein